MTRSKCSSIRWGRPLVDLPYRPRSYGTGGGDDFSGTQLTTGSRTDRGFYAKPSAAWGDLDILARFYVSEFNNPPEQMSITLSNDVFGYNLGRPQGPQLYCGVFDSCMLGFSLNGVDFTPPVDMGGSFAVDGIWDLRVTYKMAGHAIGFDAWREDGSAGPWHFSATADLYAAIGRIQPWARAFTGINPGGPCRLLAFRCNGVVLI